MQFLANILPGFREVRAAAVAGYMWLVFAWLVVSPDVDHRPANPLANSAYELIHQTGRAGAIVAASLVAYLVGAISLESSDALIRWQRNMGLAEELVREGEQRGLHAISMRESEMTGSGVDEGQARQHAEEERETLETQRLWAERNVNIELGLPPLLLAEDRAQLFEEADRLKAEGDLRLAVVFPGVALSLLAAIEASPFWAISFGFLAALMVQGIRRRDESRRVLATAISQGAINSRALAKFNREIETLEQAPLPTSGISLTTE